jgi:cytochrome c-type biogenesis protein CcmH/NrfF
MSSRRAPVAVLATAAVVAAVASAPAAASGAMGPATAAATPRTSLTAIWNDVMCVACHEPLSVAQSPQADSERAFIRKLVAQGLTKSQIEQQLVTQYGPAVLGKPPASGFDLTVYLLPAAILLGGLVTLTIVLPRWRLRARAPGAPDPAASPPPSAADARRLEQELARYEG